MRLAIYALLADHVLSLLWHHVGENRPPANVIADDLFGAVSVLAYLAFAAGLWRFGCVPTSTGAARPARQAFMCFASWAVLFLPGFNPRRLAFYPYRMLGLHPSESNLTSTLFVVLTGAYLWLLVRALGAAHRSLGEKLPAWALTAVGAFIVWEMLSVQYFVLTLRVTISLSPSVFLLAWVVLPLAAESVLVLALASLLRETERLLARQESPETALR